MSMRGPEYVGGASGRFHAVWAILPGKAKFALFLAVIALAIVAGCYVTFLEYVKPYEFGIMEVRIALGKSNRGIQKEEYGPGLAFVMPFGFQRMHHLPRTVQVLELTEDTSTSVKLGPSVFHGPAVKIQTSDGFSVSIDATILYRIKDPYLVITSLGPGDRYLQQGILPKAEPILKETLGQLTTEEFYDSSLRVDKAEMAKERLNTEMQNKGIAVEQVLVRYFRYSEAIQNNIEKKKLQDQLVFTNHSKRKAAIQQQDLNRATTRGEMEVQVTLEEGRAYGVEKKAATDLYTRKKKAEGDLLVQLAEAKSAEMRNAAMQAQGSERMVAMKMAEVLDGLDTILVPAGGSANLNPLDLEAMLKMFGATLEDRPGAPPAAMILPPLPESAAALDKPVTPAIPEVFPEFVPTPIPEPLPSARSVEGEAAAEGEPVAEVKEVVQ